MTLALLEERKTWAYSGVMWKQGFLPRAVFHFHPFLFPLPVKFIARAEPLTCTEISSECHVLFRHRQHLGNVMFYSSCVCATSFSLEGMVPRVCSFLIFFFNIQKKKSFHLRVVDAAFRELRAIRQLCADAVLASLSPRSPAIAPFTVIPVLRLYSRAGFTP